VNSGQTTVGKGKRKGKERKPDYKACVRKLIGGGSWKMWTASKKKKKENQRRGGSISTGHRAGGKNRSPRKTTRQRWLTRKSTLGGETFQPQGRGTFSKKNQKVRKIHTRQQKVFEGQRGDPGEPSNSSTTPAREGKGTVIEGKNGIKPKKTKHPKKTGLRKTPLDSGKKKVKGRHKREKLITILRWSPNRRWKKKGGKKSQNAL